MRPTLCLANRKSFVAPELFTGLCGELREALLAAGGITLETVSDQPEYTTSPIQIGKPNLRGRATIGATDSPHNGTPFSRTQIIFRFFPKKGGTGDLARPVRRPAGRNFEIQIRRHDSNHTDADPRRKSFPKRNAGLPPGDNRKPADRNSRKAPSGAPYL